MENTIGSTAPGKSALEPTHGGKTTRSALGDISNRSQAVPQGKAGTKKPTAVVETRRVSGI